VVQGLINKCFTDTASSIYEKNIFSKKIRIIDSM